jgi:SAM-dependent methyltransferase
MTLETDPTRTGFLVTAPAVAERLVFEAFEAYRHLGPEVTLLDPFVGSGNILAAAARYGVSLVGRDIDPSALALAQRRLAQLYPAPTLTLGNAFDSREPVDVIATHPPFISAKQQRDCFQHCLAQLREGGVLAMVVPARVADSLGARRVLPMPSIAPECAIDTCIVVHVRGKVVPMPARGHAGRRRAV